MEASLATQGAKMEPGSSNHVVAHGEGHVKIITEELAGLHSRADFSRLDCLVNVPVVADKPAERRQQNRRYAFTKIARELIPVVGGASPVN